MARSTLSLIVTEKEFAINKAVVEMGDLQLLGELNTFRGMMELNKTLEGMLKDTHGRVWEIMKELIPVEVALDESKKRLELANAYSEISDKFHIMSSLSSHPCHVMVNNELSPLPLTPHRPNKMPLLADNDQHHNKKCFRCKEVGHIVQQCPKEKVNKPRHRKNRRAVRGVEVEVREEQITNRSPPLKTEEFTLLEHIALFDRQAWTPEVCNICSKLNAKHSELECPLYKKCKHCRGTGLYGYRCTHTCYPNKGGYNIVDMDVNKCDYDLYWNGKD